MAGSDQKYSAVEARFAGPFLSHSGFAKMNREIVKRLVAGGAKIQTFPIGSQVDVSEDIVKEINRLSAQNTSDKCPCVYGMTIPSLMNNAGPRILYTMMESSKGIHREYAERLCLSSEIWVPSEYLRKILVDAGVSSKTFTMPLGVDPVIFSPTVKPMQLPLNTKKFKFLSLFWWSYRKGYDLLPKAYAREFSADDDVCLIISTKPHASGRAGSEAKMEEIRKIVNFIVKGVRPDKPPQVIVHNDYLSENELASLYTACDAFALLSRGEGFGLPYFEAGACGLPVIATNCTAQSDYLDESVAYMIEPDGYQVSSAIHPSTGKMAQWCRFYEDQSFPQFDDSSVTWIGERMREIYKDPNKGKGKGSALRQKILKSLTWDHAADRVATRLVELSALGGPQ